MAKSRSKKTRKTARSTARTAAAKRKGTRKAKASRSRRRAPKAAAPQKDVLNLKKLRKDLERAVSALAGKTTRDEKGRQAVDTAQERLTRWIAEADDFCTEEMQEICGPTMEIELSA